LIRKLRLDKEDAVADTAGVPMASSYGNVWVQNVSCGRTVNIKVIFSNGPDSGCQRVYLGGPAVTFYASLGWIQKYQTITEAGCPQ
jgi:hypothetical protein